MTNFYRRSIPLLMATVFGTGVIGITGIATAQTQGDPPARVGRLAFTEGTVSIHDAQDANWSAASVNDSLTTGDSLWTEPNARSEISVSGTRVRLDQSTQVDMLKIDDSATRLQLDQGRLDIKTFTMDTAQPYEIVTPRGIVKLEGQGDYYVESGSTQDPTRLGVRSGAAVLTGLNGESLAVRAGEVGEISGDAASPQLHTVRSAPPPVPQYWAQRDQQISYAQPQYISSDVVGYEDMQAYGGWSNDSDYGQVWSPNRVPDGWQPYSTGQWAYSQPYGWTWVDEQPWGFAPYHYGRWANRNNRWFWVPPERRERAVYAPALVAFVGGAELSLALGNASGGHVGWFPLGPREAYVPPYTNDRAYYERINTNARVERAVMDDRWQRAERHEAIRADEQNERMANRRFATVVPAQAFVSSQRVERSAIKVSADKLALAPVAAVSAPPSPNQSLSALKAGDPQSKEQADQRAKADADAKARGNFATNNTRFNGVPELARPAPAQRTDQRNAPGPKTATTTPNQPAAAGAKPNLPPLEPRNGAAPPKIEGERTQGQQPNAPQAQQPNAPQANRPREPNRPNEANRPAETNRPNEANRVEPPKPGKPGESAAPQGQQTHRPEPPKAAEAPRPAEAPRAPNQPLQAPQAQHAEPQRPTENHPAPPQAQRPEPPRAPEQHQAQPEPPRQPEPQRPAENRAAPPAAPPQHVEPPRQAVAPPQPQPQRAPAPPPQTAAPAPHPAATPPAQQAQAPHPAPPAPAAPAAKPEEKK
jgi:hypothetical protein